MILVRVVGSVKERAPEVDDVRLRGDVDVAVRRGGERRARQARLAVDHLEHLVRAQLVRVRPRQISERHQHAGQVPQRERPFAAARRRGPRRAPSAFSSSSPIFSRRTREKRAVRADEQVARAARRAVPSVKLDAAAFAETRRSAAGHLPIASTTRRRDARSSARAARTLRRPRSTRPARSARREPRPTHRRFVDVSARSSSRRRWARRRVLRHRHRLAARGGSVLRPYRPDDAADVRRTRVRDTLRLRGRRCWRRAGAAGPVLQACLRSPVDRAAKPGDDNLARTPPLCRAASAAGRWARRRPQLSPRSARRRGSATTTDGASATVGDDSPPHAFPTAGAVERGAPTPTPSRGRPADRASTVLRAGVLAVISARWRTPVARAAPAPHHGPAIAAPPAPASAEVVLRVGRHRRRRGGPTSRRVGPTRAPRTARAGPRSARRRSSSTTSAPRASPPSAACASAAARGARARTASRDGVDLVLCARG